MLNMYSSLEHWNLIVLVIVIIIKAYPLSITSPLSSSPCPPGPLQAVWLPVGPGGEVKGEWSREAQVWTAARHQERVLTLLLSSTEGDPTVWWHVLAYVTGKTDKCTIVEKERCMRIKKERMWVRKRMGEKRQGKEGRCRPWKGLITTYKALLLIFGKSED